MASAVFAGLVAAGCAGSSIKSAVGGPYSEAKALHSVYDQDDGRHLRESLERAAHSRNLTVSILSDTHHVPHIGGSSTVATFFAQGFTHAYYRLWQMEIGSRIAEGTVSEIMGSQSVEIDRVLRPYEINRAAIKSLAKMMNDPGTRLALSAYVEGVNAWIDQLNPAMMPVEFLQFKSRPRKFEAIDAARIVTLLSWSANNPTVELRLSRTRADISASLFERLFPWPGPKVRPAPAVNLKPDESPIDFSYDFWAKSLPNTGSNAFVAPGTSDEVFLANDFHMKFQLPTHFMPMQIMSNEFNAIGSSMPGVPGILSGTNGNVAWGYVASMADEGDWFRLELRPGHPDEYRWNGGWKKFDIESTVIQSKDAPSITIVQKRSAAGPMIGAVRSPTGIVELAYRWNGEDGRNYILPFTRRLTMEKAADCGDLESVKNSGPYVLTCTDTRNQTGVWLLAEVAERPAHQDPRVLMLAKGDRDLWRPSSPSKSTLPKNPNAFPIKTKAVLANSDVDLKQDRIYVGWNFSPRDRSTRLNDLLSKASRYSFEDVLRIQSDITSAKTERTRGAIVGIGRRYVEKDFSPSKQCAKSVVDEIEKWNGLYDSASNAPRLFLAWQVEIGNRLWSNLIGPQNPRLWPNAWTTVELLNGKSALWDNKKTPAIESKDDIVVAALQAVCESRKNPAGEDVSATSEIVRPPKFLSLPPGLFEGIDNLKADGSGETVFAQRGNHGTTYRSIISLGKETRFWTVAPGGISGDPKSQRSTDWFRDWSDRRIFESPFLSNSELMKRQ